MAGGGGSSVMCLRGLVYIRAERPELARDHGGSASGVASEVTADALRPGGVSGRPKEAGQRAAHAFFQSASECTSWHHCSEASQAETMS